MANLLTMFFKRTSGSIAVLGAVLISVIALTTSFTIDYSRSVTSRVKIQRAADAATLVAASTYRDTKDEGVALERAKAYFDNVSAQIDGVTLERSFEVGEAAESGEITANGSVVIVFDSIFKNSAFDRVMATKIEALAIVRNTPQDLYLVLLVDSTASMNTLIDSVRDAARDLETDVRAKLALKGLEYNHLYVKVAFFGDLRLDPVPYGWRESPLYDLSLQKDIDAFRHFVANTPTYYGYDNPESSPAAIAHFLTAPLPEPLKRASTVQSIVLWTDESGLMFDHSWLTDDVTVNLYKRLGNLGADKQWYYLDTYGWINTHFRQLYYTEDTEYDGDAIGTEAVPPTYGCCSSAEVFEDRWLYGGAVPLKQRTLGLIVPVTKPPWTDMITWKNVTMRDYATPSASGIIDDVVDSLNGKYSPLAISH